MSVRVVTAIAAAAVLALGTWIELRYRRRAASSEHDEFGADDAPAVETAGMDEDAVADIIRRARPALERAAGADQPDQRPKT